jgi:hypothetical protein
VTAIKRALFHPAAFIAAVLCCALAWQTVAPPPSAAQRTRVTPRRNDQYEVTSQLAEAMRYLSSDPERSLGILRNLDRKFPNNERIVYRIGYAFQVRRWPRSTGCFRPTATM